MFEYESVVAPEGIPLQAQVEELRRRAQTVARLQGGHTHYLEEVRIFREYIEEHRFLLRRSKASLNLPPDEEGNEHQVWFLPEESRFIKVTWPDFFGLSVLYRQDEDSHASPIAYLERWQLHNELFGDNGEFVGVLMEGTKMRLVYSNRPLRGFRHQWSISIASFRKAVGLGSKWQVKSLSLTVNGALSFRTPTRET